MSSAESQANAAAAPPRRSRPRVWASSALRGSRVRVTGADAPHVPAQRAVAGRSAQERADHRARHQLRNVLRSVRLADQWMTPDEGADEGAQNTVHPRVPSVYDSVKLRFVVFDGGSPIMPQVVLHSVSPLMRIYPRPSRGGGLLHSLSRLSMFGEEGAEEEEEVTLMHVLLANDSYRAVLAKVLERRDATQFVNPSAKPVWADVPVFYSVGKRISPSQARSAGIVTVQDLMREDAATLGVGWIDKTIDVALNPEADRFLSTRHYTTSVTLTVYVESAELHAAVSRDAPFGLPPSTYVVVQHGAVTRRSFIVRDTRTPVFEWSSGPLDYEPTDAIKVRLMLARYGFIREDDPIIGQFWLPAPAVPMPRNMVYPVISAFSLGTNVGRLHLALRGPIQRRAYVPGCVCALMPSVYLPLCGTPPCCPSLLTHWRRNLQSVARCITGEAGQACAVATQALCCCFVGTSLVLGLNHIRESESELASNVRGAASRTARTALQTAPDALLHARSAMAEATQLN